jgi:glutamate synthase domain-containing protein 1
LDWDAFTAELARELGASVELHKRGPDAVVTTDADAAAVFAALPCVDPTVRLFGHGRSIEVFKNVGPALEVCQRYGVPDMAGYQAIGHTRMATESAVTTEHSHPFAIAPDLCLVHNGSFSNYASVRRDLLDEGVRFDTDNDSEVAARFIASRLSTGDDLSDALRGVLKVFDGFFTLLVATGDEIAVVRDSFACKPMVVAETDDYVAIASEYVALADLPGIEKADVFEPMPEEIHTWPS